MKITIIGDGRFGKYLQGQIHRATGHQALLVGEKTHLNPEITDCTAAIFCVPIRHFAQAWENYLPHWKPGAVLLDTCSVKTYPCEIMQKCLRDDLIITGTHPLFGPQSAPVSCAGQRTAIVAVRGEPTFARTLFEPILGTTPILCTSAAHDKAMSTQLLNHFIGRAAAQAGIGRVELSTKTHELFMDIVDIVCGNSPELFEDMNRFNPFAEETRREFLAAAENLHSSLARLGMP